MAGDDRAWVRNASQLALAKLGERKWLRRLQSDLRNPKPSVQFRAADDLSYVGGWFAVATLESWITDSGENDLMRFSGHEVFGTRRQQALRLLPKILPEAGIATPTAPELHSAEAKAILKRWVNWIREHYAELKKRSPQP
jgi:hypothetical protein